MNKIVCSLIIIFISIGCQSQQVSEAKAKSAATLAPKEIVIGAARFDQYIGALKNKKVGLLVNHSSLIDGVHLVDLLRSKSINVTTLFSPEHGFRGTAANGEKVNSGIDEKTGLPIISLYGKNKKPTPEQLANVDVVVFDIQDVGARFYTYISTMHYMMDACAKAGKPMIILDRPNPNGMYIDGPILEPAFVSNVGLHPIPIVHGLTVAELALMINGEGWLESSVTCELKVVIMENYNHTSRYSLPVRPSPNLPNDQSIMLYPSLCLFEGTVISVGRGTEFPFQLIGHPEFKGEYKFTPETLPGTMAPKFVGKECSGVLLKNEPAFNKINLSWLLDAHLQFKKNESPFFNNYFNTLAGTALLREQIETGKTESEIRASWKPGIDTYKQIRKKYLLYKDFE